MNYRLPSIFGKVQYRSNLASYLVITAMMVCVSIAFIQVAFWFTGDSQGFHWGYIPFLAAVVSLESIFTRPVARELEGRERILYHLAEWVTIAVLLKVVYYLVRGVGQILVDLPLWQENFISFFQGEYFFALLFLAAVWLVSHVSANDIEALNVDPSDSYWDIGKLMNTRGSIRQGLVSRLLWIGTFLVLIVTVIRASVIAAPGSMNLQAPVINIMAYFALALVLFSQTQFAMLRGRWFWHDTPISRFLTSAWIRYSLLFFGILAIVSILLPTSYSMGLIETLSAVFGLLFNLVLAFIQLLLIPILWLLSMAGCTRQTQAAVTATPAPLPVPPPSVSQDTPLPWLQLAQSILFWVLLIGIVGYALVQFIRQNPQFQAFFQNIRAFHYFFSLWRWLKNWAVSTSKTIGGALEQIQMRLTPKRDAGLSLVHRAANWVNFRQLTPREQIIFYYLRLLDRGAEHGIRRKHYETPSQYARTLESQLPEVEQDISGITDTFMEARYSVHPIPTEKTTIAQRFWRNIVRSLNRLGKFDPNSKKI